MKWWRKPRSRKARALWSLAIGALALVIVGGGYRAWRAHNGRILVDELPHFTEPGPGPRATTTRWLGFDVGRTTLDSARARLASLSVTCRDTSVRALMKSYRENKVAAAVAAGEDVDAVSSASWNRPSRRERNPQVRLSCDGVLASKLDARFENDVKGRLLLVFDSPTHPLRHVSFRRMYIGNERATEDARSAMDEARAQFGEPTSTRGTSWEWSFADLRARVESRSVVRVITVNDVVEVPWPVRADAPSLQIARKATP